MPGEAFWRDARIVADFGGAGADDFGRLRWMKEAIAAFGCIGTGGIVAVGDRPGQGESLVNFLRGAYPNPARSSGTTITFTLEKAMPVTLRIYNVAGRLVHETDVQGLRGGNEIRWQGESSLGISVSPGVYFYRLSAPGASFQGNNRRVVILSTAAR